MKHLVIVGGGPRGLGLALYARHKDLKVTMLDPNPTSSWAPYNIISNIVMRSPLSFDLVTSLDCLRKYSLYSFLKGEDKIFNTQKEIEYDNERLDRNQFYSYLQFISSSLDINYIKDSLAFCSEGSVTTTGNQIIKCDAIALCLGNVGPKNNPFYLSGNLNYKMLDNNALLSNTIKDSKLAVIGSGQGAAEAVDYLIDGNNFVYWISNEVKINNYPIPSYSEWGLRSALGSFYSTITTEAEKKQYLSKVKAWTPSITPLINRSLNSKSSRFQIINPRSFNLSNILEEVDGIHVNAGIKTSAECASKYFCYKLPLNKNNSNFPDLNNKFKLRSSNIYFSGSLATYCDGPRQGSVISIGNTSKIIVEDIINGGDN